MCSKAACANPATASASPRNWSRPRPATTSGPSATTAIAPGYGRAHSLLAWALLRRTTWSGNLQLVMPEISAEARAALALDDRDPWAHFAQGNSLFRLRRFGESVRALRRALELNPNFALAHAYLGTSLAMQGAHQEAVDSAERALRLSPRD